MGALGILDLLSLRGFDPKTKAKLVRHQHARYGSELYKRGWFEPYQRFQGKPIFDGCDYVVSFVGAGQTRARFVGIYRVGARIPASDAPKPKDCPPLLWAGAKHHYDLEKCSGYEDLEGRIIVEWGKGVLSWHQHLRNKEVVEVLASGDALDPFEDYLEFVLTHEDLKHLFEHPQANREWRARLQAISGVYLILASTTGDQYVGSAYGEGGVWGRWEQYARNGHGGNRLLKSLVESDLPYPEQFVYSLLQVLPKTMTSTEVIRWESRYKEKLGSRATGLNLN